MIEYTKSYYRNFFSDEIMDEIENREFDSEDELDEFLRHTIYKSTKDFKGQKSDVFKDLKKARKIKRKQKRKAKRDKRKRGGI